MAQEEDAISTIEGAPKRMAEFLMELYKVLRDQKQQQKMMQQQQANQEAMQKQQQEFMAEQNQKLMDAFKQSGVQPTDENVKLAKDELVRLDKIAELELEATEKIDAIDKRLDEIDKETQELLDNPSESVDAPSVESPGPSPEERMKQLNVEKFEIERGIREKEALLRDPKTERGQQASILQDLNKLDNAKLEVDKKIATEKQGPKTGQAPSMDANQRLARMRELSGEKAKLEKDKLGLKGQLKDLETERVGISKGEGLKKLKGPEPEGLKQGAWQQGKVSPGLKQPEPTEKRGPTIGAGRDTTKTDSLKGPGKQLAPTTGISESTDRPSHFVGGVDTSKSRSKSVGASLYGEAEKAGKFNQRPHSLSVGQGIKR